MIKFFTSESVSSGHPDKVADQISDAILDEMLKQDRNTHVACETLVTTGLAVVSGEVSTTGYVDIQKIVRDTIIDIGYDNGDLYFDGHSCAVINTIHEQSPDIAMGVNKHIQGAGDQGIMFGYAIKDGIEYMPLEIMLSHKILQCLETLRKGYPEIGLRPDAKSQVTIAYNDEGKPIKIDTIIISQQHCENFSMEILTELIQEAILMVRKDIPHWVSNLFYDYKLLVNPTGRFVIGGPHGDTGLTGRKIIVDTYGGKCPHGGGAFSGKDPSKVDRSAAYFCRYVAKNLVAAGVADEVIIQVSYAIGVAEPISIFVNTNGTCNIGLSDTEIADRLHKNIDFTPYGMITKLDLLNPIYLETAKYGHFGRQSYVKDGIKYFPWEDLDFVEKMKNIFEIV
jgi:S-adenosylmethionine synthetase